ncbi:hypothetical protein [Lachnoclostridium phytofermentans]|uniref:Uncharacterized protein n=1 Tax=Lachnoclostridium phytofermentans (strain ATCC 700394 / DSM 18823 / ISDg) TaxID=357809 RepID=A9KQE2_LACP7|nr:hypothetical protein [Lachnoclostridium phytofermentans]ABX40451.1 hypothetical protein Cphy_0061 [Lachnoclostridium phytofermentans ISDg]
MLNIPGTCVKCGNHIELERHDNLAGAAYCPSCDFVLELTKEEFDQVSLLIEE